MVSDNITGVLLAGGKSSRFGANKALSKLAGITMIEHPAGILTELFKNRLLITNTPAEYAFLGWPMVGDIYPDAGPLAGIHAALKSVTSPLIFVAGCDMPFLDKSLIRYLYSLTEGYDVIVPRTDQGREPLHAIYRQSIVEVLEENLARGNRKIHQILAELNIREVGAAEMLAENGNLNSFRNINTIADLPE